MNITLRRAAQNELYLLEEVEKFAFPALQQSTRTSLRRSLQSSFQQVWVAEAADEYGKCRPAGVLIMHMHRKSLRIFSIGVLPAFQGMGIGKKLLHKAEETAAAAGFGRILLEADADNMKLLQWYYKSGFEFVKRLPDYYAPGHDAVKLTYKLPVAGSEKTTNIIVVDDPGNWPINARNALVVGASDYITGKNGVAGLKARIFNLCNSYSYQSKGYYVSLLASARDQRAIPNVATIRDFRDVSVIRAIAEDEDGLIQKALSGCKEDRTEFSVYFGQTENETYKTLAKKLYKLFEAPLFKVQFIYDDKWRIEKLKAVSLNKIKPEEYEMIQRFATQYFNTKRFSKGRLKTYSYYLGILINPEEQNPPSDRLALKRLKEAAERAGVYPEFITKEDYNRLSEFDALFIRETTNVNNYTYQFSRKAYAEGLVVIDDPWSILRCSNKIYLHECLLHNRIKTPKTEILSRERDDRKYKTAIGFPLILKQPDSAFSRGVVKVRDRGEFEAKLKELFKKSELVLVQEYLPTEYDWRIGVLDNQPVFACRYFMARDHWQIYNWNGKRGAVEGGFDAVPLPEVPHKILETALKAAGLMGDGLYGVDLKEINGTVYVIEVNDNPNIDGGVEDKIPGRALYDRLMKSFIARIEAARNIERFASIAPDD